MLRALNSEHYRSEVVPRELIRQASIYYRSVPVSAEFAGYMPRNTLTVPSYKFCERGRVG